MKKLSLNLLLFVTMLVLTMTSCSSQDATSGGATATASPLEARPPVRGMIDVGGYELFYDHASILNVCDPQP